MGTARAVRGKAVVKDKAFLFIGDIAGLTELYANRI